MGEAQGEEPGKKIHAIPAISTGMVVTPVANTAIPADLVVPASLFVDKLQDSKEQLLPPEFDQAASRAGVWSKRIAATTALAVIAITLTYVTKAAWLVFALAFAVRSSVSNGGGITRM